MPGRHDRNVELPSLGGKSAVILFVLTLFAFVVESQLTQYVQTNLEYRQPFFLFYVVHSSFITIFPLHLAFLAVKTQSPVEPLLSGLFFAIKTQFAPHAQRHAATIHRSPFPTFRFLRLIVLLTVGVTVPGLLWFASVSLSPISDVTAIWNTNAFFAYLITVRLFKLDWEPRKLAAVVLATLGTLAVVYGGVQQADVPSSSKTRREPGAHGGSAKAPVVGDLLTLCASVGYGLYQVLYKRHAALPSDPEFESSDTYIPVSLSTDDLSNSLSGDLEDNLDLDGAVYPPPFGFHPNFLTSAIGLCTFILLSIFLPILHYTNAESFRLPSNLSTVVSIAGIALSGVAFNSGLMILLGIWGPIVVSVGNLLTIVLVFLSDIILGQAADAITFWSLTGAGGIVLAFGVLVYDMLQHR
ncbi:hypothetical protein BV25DRAFT_1793344 [Artomyces pyxidatus]|uniref:Uncharacterized protein n=1 Tax=Artomyces pyxidatus TaxID=48021 RepID=A0ACB8TIC1_9AGAM|nr:hypothetical protein BV25DRAFT_1793344 [Artomyces pyxidatus]